MLALFYMLECLKCVLILDNSSLKKLNYTKEKKFFFFPSYLILTSLIEFKMVRIPIIAAAIISPFVAAFQLANSTCILCSLKPSNRRQGYYTYYLEMPNGTRLRQMAEVVYDERQGKKDKWEQIVFFHAFLIAFVLPGFLMPYLLWLAEHKGRRILLVWWICWISLHNVHALMGLFTYGLHFMIVVHYRGFSNFDKYLGSHWSSFGLCSLATTLNNLVAPFTIYLSIYMLRYYRNAKEFSVPNVRNGSANSENIQRAQPHLQIPILHLEGSSN